MHYHDDDYYDYHDDYDDHDNHDDYHDEYHDDYHSSAIYNFFSKYNLKRNRR